MKVNNVETTPKDGSPPDHVTLPVRLSIADAKVLRDLSRQYRCSMNDTISRALAWHKFFSQETLLGRKILIEHADGSVKAVTLK